MDPDSGVTHLPPIRPSGQPRGDPSQFQPGHRLHSYQLLALIGAGGMGEVWRARDCALDRDVAIKVLPAVYSRDPERLRRFEQEARAVGQLNHPNVLTVYSVGSEEGTPYLVTELLDGETLRERLAGDPLPVRKAIGYAVQIAEGLAAAHDKEIVHRDLKPENVFVTHNGHIKILDFGLARLVEADTTGVGRTSTGMILGTAGYMAPEQVRGEAADHRADIFAFGAILYEMLAGRQAFTGGSPVERMTATLKEEPPALEHVPPSVDRIVRRCLEKNAPERFQSARDLAFALPAVSDADNHQVARQVRAWRRAWPLAAAVVALAAVVVALLSLKGSGTPLPTFTRLTFGEGTVTSARFGPGGRSVVYGATFGGGASLWVKRPESPDAERLGLDAAELLAVSPSGELAVKLRPRALRPFVTSGTLARMPMGGGAARELIENISDADWSPDGSAFAVIIEASGRSRLEYPAGRTLFETAGTIRCPRVSPKGDQVAFLHSPSRGKVEGEVTVVGAGHAAIVLATGVQFTGIAWAPRADEVWFGQNGDLRAVALSGRARDVLRVPGILDLQDVSNDGRILASLRDQRMMAFASGPDSAGERDVSWLRWSLVADLTADGRTLLFSENGDVCLRGTNGSAITVLGEGWAWKLSPDGRWALVTARGFDELRLLPTGPGEPRSLPRGPIEKYGWGTWFPDGQRIAFSASERGHGMRIYVQEVAGGPPQAVSPEGVGFGSIAVSPDGSVVVAPGRDSRPRFFAVNGGEGEPVPGLEAGDYPISFGADGRWLFFFPFEPLPSKIYRLDTSTGRREPLHTIVASQPASVAVRGPASVTPDGRYYAHSYLRVLSTLYVIEGQR
jgi:hypothetical protein